MDYTWHCKGARIPGLVVTVLKLEGRLVSAQHFRNVGKGSVGLLFSPQRGLKHCMDVARITDAVGRMHDSGPSKALVQWRYLQLLT